MSELSRGYELTGGLIYNAVVRRAAERALFEGSGVSQVLLEAAAAEQAVGLDARAQVAGFGG